MNEEQWNEEFEKYKQFPEFKRVNSVDLQCVCVCVCVSCVCVCQTQSNSVICNVFDETCEINKDTHTLTHKNTAYNNHKLI